ncbi:cobalt ECF transporter T component CbiQ [Actinospongicola halichondriae]|uniref:cobalt ECF transporter T component CbiQ n=1 Tax=Actinospongicola halichondriae TaxID=3236844 RepID=UPI003D48FE11
MAGAHASSLHVPGDSLIHRLRPQCKLAAALAFVFVVVATPREQIWAFGIYAVVLLVLARAASLPLGLVVRRLTIDTPFLAFAFFLPFFAGGEQIGDGWWSLSIDGLWAAWNIVAKGTLGVATSVILTGTTSLPDLIAGLDRLHAPRAFTAITSFMVRYAEVIAGETHRMKIARESRGHDPRWIWQIRAIAHSAGTLFVRSYERGERVYLAMLSRGFDGSMPRMADDAASRREWLTAAALPTAACFVAAGAWMVQT